MPASGSDSQQGRAFVRVVIRDIQASIVLLPASRVEAVAELWLFRLADQCFHFQVGV